jgi:hypothetical protein
VSNYHAQTEQLIHSANKIKMMVPMTRSSKILKKLISQETKEVTDLAAMNLSKIGVSSEERGQ